MSRGEVEVIDWGPVDIVLCGQCLRTTLKREPKSAES